MTGDRFVAVPANTSAVSELAALTPANPFATSSFFESMRRDGLASWVLGLSDATGRLACGCAAFVKSGRLNSSLEIPSLPGIGAESAFWPGLRAFCREQGVSQLALGTFASPGGVEIPPLGQHCIRRSRCEFVLDLGGELTAKLSTNHKRNVKKGQKVGLVIRQTRTSDAAIIHTALMGLSMVRRRSRGESVGSVSPASADVAVLQSGAGELFQAVADATVLSSVLVLRAPEGGYYQSAGTSPDGMAVGASQFLIHGIAKQLKADGARVFNLGGADVESSLATFKEGFGASKVPLPSANCYVGSTWRRWASQGLARLLPSRGAS